MKRLWNHGVLYFGVIYLCYLLAATSSLFGQAATASISGRVTDTTGAAFPRCRSLSETQALLPVRQSLLTCKADTAFLTYPLVPMKFRP